MTEPDPAPEAATAPEACGVSALPGRRQSRTLLVGQGVSALGSWMGTVAVGPPEVLIDAVRALHRGDLRTGIPMLSGVSVGAVTPTAHPGGGGRL